MACREAATVDNGIGLDNEEQGTKIFVCERPRKPWAGPLGGHQPSRCVRGGSHFARDPGSDPEAPRRPRPQARRGARGDERDHGGRATPAQIGGFLVALRAKGDGGRDRRLRGGDACSRAGGAAVARRRGRRRRDRGDGGRTFNISTTAAIVAAAAGAAVAKHGNRAVSSVSGSADVLEALGFTLEQPPERIAESIDTLGFGFMFAPLHHPAMRHAAPVRRELGTRTIFTFSGR